jgi:hypothetical protein
MGQQHITLVAVVVAVETGLVKVLAVLVEVVMETTQHLLLEEQILVAEVEVQATQQTLIQRQQGLVAVQEL